MSEATNKLFLGGLNSEVSEDDIRGYFGQFGSLTDSVVMRDPVTGMSRRFGFVTFATADECMNCFNAKPHSLKDSEVDVKLATPKAGQKNPIAKRIHPDSEKKIFVGGLNHATTDESMRTYFGHYGDVTESKVMKNIETQRSRGFGFVTFSCASSVNAVQDNRPHNIDGQQVETKRAVPKDESGPKNCTKIFVGGIKEEISDNDLEAYFNSFGQITKMDQKVNKETGRKRGFAFIDFEDYDSVDKLLLQTQHVINGIAVDVKKAVPREEQAQAGHMGGGGYGMSGRGGKAHMAGGYGAAGHGGYGAAGGWNAGYGGNASAYGYGGYGNGNGWDSWQQNPAMAAAGWSEGSGVSAPVWADGGGYSRPNASHGPIRQSGRGSNRSAPYGRGGSAVAGGGSYNGASRGGGW